MSILMPRVRRVLRRIMSKRGQEFQIRHVDHSRVFEYLHRDWYHQCKHGTGHSCNLQEPKQPFEFALPILGLVTGTKLGFRELLCQLIEAMRWKMWQSFRFRIGLER